MASPGRSNRSYPPPRSPEVRPAWLMTPLELHRERQRVFDEAVKTIVQGWLSQMASLSPDEAPNVGEKKVMGAVLVQDWSDRHDQAVAMLQSVGWTIAKRAVPSRVKARRAVYRVTFAWVEKPQSTVAAWPYPTK